MVIVRWTWKWVNFLMRWQNLMTSRVSSLKTKQTKKNLLNQPEHHGNNEPLYLSLKANEQILN